MIKIRPWQRPQHTGEILKKAALFLWLGLPSTLIRHENRAFLKPRSSNQRDLKLPAFCFSVDEKHFENGAFRKRWYHDNHVISITEFFSTYKFRRRPVIVAFLNSCGFMSLDGKQLMCFQIETYFFKFTARSFDGALDFLSNAPLDKDGVNS